MKRSLVILLLAAAVVGMTACSKCSEQPKSATPAKTESPRPAVTTPATPAPTPAAPAAAPATGGGLAGTTWKLDAMTVSFKDDANLLVKGGPVQGIAPNGLDATYQLKDGVLEVNVTSIGMTKSGTFDGTKLVIDGKTAVRQQ